MLKSGKIIFCNNMSSVLKIRLFDKTKIAI